MTRPGFGSITQMLSSNLERRAERLKVTTAIAADAGSKAVEDDWLGRGSATVMAG
ncbi:hypothetical protein GCM10009816_16670 [Microbacterium aquimaris]